MEVWFENQESGIFILTKEDALHIVKVLEKEGSQDSNRCKTRLLFQWKKDGEWKV